MTASSDLNPYVGCEVKFCIFCTVNMKPQINDGTYKFNNYWIPHTYIRKQGVGGGIHTHTHTHHIHMYAHISSTCKYCTMMFLAIMPTSKRI